MEIPKCDCGRTSTVRIPITSVNDRVCTDCATEFWKGCVKAGAVPIIDRNYPESKLTWAEVKQHAVVSGYKQVKGQRLKHGVRKN